MLSNHFLRLFTCSVEFMLKEGLKTICDSLKFARSLDKFRTRFSTLSSEFANDMN